jgi:hypothetical protein
MPVGPPGAGDIKDTTPKTVFTVPPFNDVAQHSLLLGNITCSGQEKLNNSCCVGHCRFLSG